MALLKKYLTINSLFSVFSGFATLLFSDQVGQFLEIDGSSTLQIIGAGLLFFALFVWLVKREKNLNPKKVVFISLMDFLWVLGSIVIVLFNPFDLSQYGSYLIALIALWITFLGFMQLKHNKATS